MHFLSYDIGLRHLGVVGGELVVEAGRVRAAACRIAMAEVVDLTAQAAAGRAPSAKPTFEHISQVLVPLLRGHLAGAASDGVVDLTADGPVERAVDQASEPVLVVIELQGDHVKRQQYALTHLIRGFYEGVAAAVPVRVVVLHACHKLKVAADPATGDLVLNPRVYAAYKEAHDGHKGWGTGPALAHRINKEYATEQGRHFTRACGTSPAVRTHLEDLDRFHDLADCVLQAAYVTLEPAGGASRPKKRAKIAAS